MTPDVRPVASGAHGRTHLSRLLSRIGPGIITGVADDDPSGIATYAQAGAQYGFNMLWTMPLAFPLMAAVQLMCARIGRVTGKGLAANIRDSFPPVVLRLVLALLLVANTLNIAADVAAMGETAQLVTGLDRHAMTAVFVAITLGLQIFVPYDRYVFFLKWLSLSLLAYAGVLASVHVPWGAVAWHTVWPRFAWNRDSAAVIVGVFGTTISPYLFFWQSSEEVEDMLEEGTKPLREAPQTGPDALRRIGWDTWSGMFYSDVTAYIIMLATAVTLHPAGIHVIDTAGQAASALRPLAGHGAYLLFALGIFGVGLIGVPVLAASSAYAAAETFGWTWGLERRADQARAFYGIIAVSVLAGLLLQYAPINPMRALFWSAVINGIIAVPLLVVVTWLATRRAIMGAFVTGRFIAVLGWLATVVMGAAALAMLWP
ncbi:MAG: divalent metal cation transporter [Rhodospirillales bacterium]|nr:divalent metal cation transporter [Rhodospirillales bacterium]